MQCLNVTVFWDVKACHTVKEVEVKSVCGSYGTAALRHMYSYPNEFLHSSPEALHTPSGMRDLC